MILDDQTITLLLVVALAASLLLGAALVVVAVRLRRLRRAYASALDPSRREDLFQAVQRQGADLDGLRADLGVVHDNTEQLRGALARTVSKVAVVRYDAFEDMGGALSFSAALLDEAATGIVVSAINGRSETRCYAKSVVDGHSEHDLSREELAAIDAARQGRTEQVLETPRRRRRAS